MRTLAVLAIVAVLGWCGYWFVGARALDHAIVTAIDGIPEIDVADHAIQGFPNRFDVTLTEPRVAAHGVQWSAPFVQLFALSYRLNHLIAVFAHDQRIIGPGLDVAIHSEDLRASVVLEAGLSLPLDRMSLVGQSLALSAAGETHRIEGLRAASRRLSDREHDLALVLENTFPDPALMDRLDPQAIWPRRFDVLRLAAEVEVDRPLDRTLVGGPPPRVQRLTFTGARIAWEGTDIVASGRLTVGALGTLSGDLDLTVTGWRALMQSLRDAGLMPAEHDTLITMAMQGLVNADDPNRLEAGFAVVDGVVSMGPIVIGRIPALF